MTVMVFERHESLYSVDSLTVTPYPPTQLYASFLENIILMYITALLTLKKKMCLLSQFLTCISDDRRFCTVGALDCILWYSAPP